MNKNFVRSKIIERFGTVFEFCREIGIHESQMSLWLNGRRVMPLETRIRLAGILGIKTSDLEPGLWEPVKPIVRKKSSKAIVK